MFPPGGFDNSSPGQRGCSEGLDAFIFSYKKISPISTLTSRCVDVDKEIAHFSSVLANNVFYLDFY